ncbi:MAG: sigma-70 family RNA polymerase sigma factor [Phycisphaerales bacterium]
MSHSAAAEVVPAGGSEDASHTPEPSRTPGGADDDRQDLAASLEGDHIAFARIYDRHGAVVLSLCRRSVGGRSHDLAEAEDALQETFIRAFRLLDTLDDPGRLRSWLFGIARRVCSERRRSAGRRARHEEQAMSAAPSRWTIEAGGAPAQAAHHESLERLGAALDALPDDERLAVHLYYLDPDPVRAAHAALRLSRSGYYKLLARAREHLARLMKEAPAS